MGVIIQLRRNTTANWTAQNPILEIGEPGYDTNLKKIKIGDGITPWVNLPFQDKNIQGLSIGTTTPSNLTGSPGDFYNKLVDNTLTFYQKVGSVWVEKGSFEFTGGGGGGGGETSPEILLDETSPYVDLADGGSIIIPDFNAAYPLLSASGVVRAEIDVEIDDAWTPSDVPPIITKDVDGNILTASWYLGQDGYTITRLKARLSYGSGGTSGSLTEPYTWYEFSEADQDPDDWFVSIPWDAVKIALHGSAPVVSIAMETTGSTITQVVYQVQFDTYPDVTTVKIVGFDDPAIEKTILIAILKKVTAITAIRVPSTITLEDTDPITINWQTDTVPEGGMKYVEKYGNFLPNCTGYVLQSGVWEITTGFYIGVTFDGSIIDTITVIADLAPTKIVL